MTLRQSCVILGVGASLASAALSVDLSNADSIKSAASTVAYNLMTYYQGNKTGQTPGILPGPPPAGPYYWWEGGALWGEMMDYWHYTGDDTYNNETQYAMIFQSNAPADNYMPPNWTASLGNDDQGFWGMSAMLGAEVNFQNPPPSDPQWLGLAQAVFNTQADRWDTQNCNGGLRWQIPLSNNGYDYKNSIANGILFNMGARLARYTNNQTYANWAATAYNWTKDVGYIDANYNIYDGAHVEHNCTDINPAQFSYTAAVFIQGLAFMYSYTNDSYWLSEMAALTNRTFEVFFPNGIAVEPACELPTTVQCTADMLSYKSYVHRFLAQAVQVAPSMNSTIMPVLKTSAEGAVSSCNPDGTCGFRWTTGSYDGDTGAGQEMNALGALLSMLANDETTPMPVTNSTGGTSVGNPAGGGNPSVQAPASPVSNGDRAGAGILTALLLASGASCMYWMISKSNEGPAWVDNSGKSRW